MSSSSIVRASRAGSIDPAGAARGIAERAHDVQQRVGVRNGATSSERLRARPRAGDAAMSANSTVAGTCFLGLNRAVRRSSRSSGTLETPTLASDFRARRGASRALVRSWKSAVLPVESKSDERRASMGVCLEPESVAACPCSASSAAKSAQVVSPGASAGVLR